LTEYFLHYNLTEKRRSDGFRRSGSTVCRTNGLSLTRKSIDNVGYAAHSWAGATLTLPYVLRTSLVYVVAEALMGRRRRPVHFSSLPTRRWFGIVAVIRTH